MLARTGKEAKFPFLVHPHMLRHACGFKLANDGRDTRALQHYLGHKNIQHTVRYGAGKFGTTSVSSSITLAFAPASRFAKVSSMKTSEELLTDSAIIEEKHG